MLERVEKKYRVPSRNDLIRAAVRFWAVYAERCMDANLHPVDANGQPLKWEN